MSGNVAMPDDNCGQERKSRGVRDAMIIAGGSTQKDNDPLLDVHVLWLVTD